jgi:hypothetical protein
VTTTGVLVEGQPLIEALDPGFINPCDVMRAAVDAAGMSIRIPAGGRHGEIDPGFRTCHASPDGSSWASPHSGLFVGSVWSDDEAERVLGSLFTVARSSGIPGWVPTGSSTWAFDGAFNAAAVLEAPYLFVVTDDDPARAMRVAQAAAVELDSWEPDPNYVCALFDSAPVQASYLEKYATGARSFGQVCEPAAGDSLTSVHLFWRDTPTTLEQAGRLLETADDLAWLAGAEWTAAAEWSGAGAGMRVTRPGWWVTEGTDSDGHTFHAVAVSVEPHFFVVTHRSPGSAMDIAIGVHGEVIERVPPETP